MDRRGTSTPRTVQESFMSAAARPELKDARRQFWWGEHELIDFGIIRRVGTSAWAVYTCLLRHASPEGVAFPGVALLQAETGLSNRLVAKSIKILKDNGLIDVQRKAHQSNVYRVLDVMHSIRAQGWERLTRKADDEKSPAPLISASKQVTKMPSASDEKSPEQVTNSHAKKNQFKKHQEKEGGVTSVTGNARATVPPPESAQHVPPERTTTFSFELPKPPVARLRSASGPPMGPPDGGAADAAVVNGGFDLLGDQVTAGQEPATVTGLEKVPRAAAASVLTLEGPGKSILALRPTREIAGPSSGLLASLVGGRDSLKSLLFEITPSGGLSRQLWLKLTDDELTLVRVTAQAEAQASGINFRTLVIRGLDRLIGAPAKPPSSGSATDVALPGAYLTPAEKQAQLAQHLAPEVNQHWKGRRNKQTYRIEEVTSQSVFVDGLGEYPLQLFHQTFELVDPAASGVA